MDNIWRPSFSHIYMERDAENFPLTAEILQKFPRAKIVPIGHYKDVFNRAGQDFFMQKQSPKLILAVRRENFLLPGSGLCDDFGHGYDHFYYAVQMFNCPYDCAYCYLRGLYGSANLVAFVNTEGYLNAARGVLPAFVSISYDSDLLAAERIFRFVESWVGFASANPSLDLEIRTKSAAFSAIRHVPPPPNVVLSWTVSPGELCAKYERNTPGLAARLAAVASALENNWRVRLCADPVLLVPGWEKIYARMFAVIQESIDIKKLHGVTAGGFRVPQTFYRKMLRFGDTALPRLLPLTERGGAMRYTEADETKIQDFISGCLK